MIRFYCKHCGASLKAPEASAGKNGRCPSCSEIFRVPASGDAADGALAPGFTVVACPWCGARLRMRVAEAAPGRRAACAACRSAFTVSASPPVQPPPPPAPPRR